MAMKIMLLSPHLTAMSLCASASTSLWSPEVGGGGGGGKVWRDFRGVSGRVRRNSGISFWWKYLSVLISDLGLTVWICIVLCCHHFVNCLTSMVCLPIMELVITIPHLKLLLDVFIIVVGWIFPILPKRLWPNVLMATPVSPVLVVVMFINVLLPSLKLITVWALFDRRPIFNIW